MKRDLIIILSKKKIKLTIILFFILAEKNIFLI